MEPLLLVLVLVVIWVVILWAFNSYDVGIPNPPKGILNLLLVVLMAVSLLWAAGLFGGPFVLRR
jgi:nitric oxide reductase large subunit